MSTHSQGSNSSFSNVSFETLKFIKDGEEYDIHPSRVASMDIYESITSMGITGTIRLKDWDGFKELGEIFIGDSIEISWKSSGASPLSFVGKIFASPGDIYTSRHTFKTVVFHFASPWFFESLTRSISRAYSKQSVDNILIDLVSLCGGSVQEVNPVPDLTLERFVAPYWTPAHTMKYLLNHLQGGATGGYLLYTDISTGRVNIETIDSLFSGSQGEDPLKLVQNSKSQFYGGHTSEFIIESSFDAGKYLNQGMGGTHLHGFDYDGGSHFSFHENPTEYTHNHLSKGFPLLSEQENGDYDSHRFSWLSPKTSKQTSSRSPGENLLSGRLRTIYSLLMSDTVKINVKTPGFTGRRCGTLIKADVPSILRRQGSGQKDKHFEGNYLIRNIRHMFDEDSYIQAITIISDGLKDYNRNDLMNW